MSLCRRFGVFSERRGRHAERPLEGELRYFHQPTKQRRGASRMTHSRRMLALADLHAGCRQQDQSLEEHARWAASIHNLPKTFPGLMSFPVITVIDAWPARLRTNRGRGSVQETP